MSLDLCAYGVSMVQDIAVFLWWMLTAQSRFSVYSRIGRQEGGGGDVRGGWEWRMMKRGIHEEVRAHRWAGESPQSSSLAMFETGPHLQSRSQASPPWPSIRSQHTYRYNLLKMPLADRRGPKRSIPSVDLGCASLVVTVVVFWLWGCWGATSSVRSIDR
jgi:hypothetical protein